MTQRVPPAFAGMTIKYLLLFGQPHETLNSTIPGDAKYCVSTKGCSLEDNGAKGFRTELTGPNKRLLQDNRSTG